VVKVGQNADLTAEFFAFLLHIWKVLNSNIGTETRYPGLFFVVFLGLSRQMLG
jgi:hypothetical protein